MGDAAWKDTLMNLSGKRSVGAVARSLTTARVGRDAMQYHSARGFAAERERGQRLEPARVGIKPGRRPSVPSVPPPSGTRHP